MLWLLLACTSPDDSKNPATDSGATDSHTGDTDTGTGDTDSGKTGTDSGTTDDSGTTGTDSGKTDDSGTTTTTGLLTLRGNLTATAGTDQSGDAFLGLFDQDPISNQGIAPVGGTTVLNADLSGGASVPFTIENVTPGPTTLYVIGFLDNDQNASQSGGGPDEGDLMIGNGGVAPSVVCTDAASCTINLVFDVEGGPPPA